MRSAFVLRLAQLFPFCFLIYFYELFLDFHSFWFWTIIISSTIGFITYGTTKIKTTWIKLGDDAIATWNVMNSSQWTSHFVQVSINDLFPTLLLVPEVRRTGRALVGTHSTKPNQKNQKPWLDGDPLEWASFASDLNFILLWDPRTAMAQSSMGQSWE